MRYSRKRKEKKSGFTLIELLVVISIISILLALLFPSLVGFGKKARELKYRSFLVDFDTSLKTYQLHYNARPYYYEITGADRWINIQTLVRLLAPGKIGLTGGLAPSVNQTSSFLEVPNQYISSAGLLEDLYGTEPKMKVEVSKVTTDPTGRELKRILYSLGENKHDETDMRAVAVNQAESRIYKTDLNRKKIPISNKEYDDITTAW